MINRDINLLPYDVIRQRNSRQSTSLIILLMILFAVSALSLMLIPYNKIQSLKTEASGLQSKISSVKDITKLENLVATEKSNMSIRQKVKDTAQITESNMNTFYTKIEEIIPKDLSIVKLNVIGDKLTIDGVAKNRDIVADFNNSLKNIDFFSDVFVNGIKNMGPSGNNKITFSSDVAFIINCNIKK